MRIDLNADLGEGAGTDDALMPLVTSANIACGGHTGDDASMQAAVTLARKHGVAIGAHPSFEDRAHFGRRELPLPAEAIYTLVRGQVARLQAHGQLRHVKPHGALYNLAARDATVARAVAQAVADTDPTLILVARPGGELVRAGRALGLRVAQELFADRTYQPDGSLTPRAQPAALIHDVEAACAQVLSALQHGWVRSVTGATVRIAADTVCVHGDGEEAVRLTRALREALAGAGVRVAALE